MSTKPLTPGRLQMVLFLARKNDWVLVSNVFKHANDGGANPEGITSLGGARKALKEIEYVELENITPTGRPNYRCRLECAMEPLHHLIASLNDPDSQRAFMASSYYHDLIPDIVRSLDVFIPSADALRTHINEHYPGLDRNCDIKLSEKDKELLTESLKINWQLLNQVLNMISVSKIDERFLTIGMISMLQYDRENSDISPLAAWYDGFYTAIESTAKHISTPFKDIKPALDKVMDTATDRLRNAPLVDWQLFIKMLNQQNTYSQIFYTV